MDGDALAFDVTSEANPNNVTPATQGVMLRVRHDPRARLCAVLSGQRVGIPLERLFEGAKSGNLGLIDTPAWRFHALPRRRNGNGMARSTWGGFTRARTCICGSARPAARWRGRHRSSAGAKVDGALSRRLVNDEPEWETACSCASTFVTESRSRHPLFDGPSPSSNPAPAHGPQATRLFSVGRPASQHHGRSRGNWRGAAYADQEHSRARAGARRYALHALAARGRAHDFRREPR